MANLYMGIMTGTSLDGIDIALVDFSKEPGELVAFQTYDYPKDLRLNILAINQNQPTTISAIGDLDYRLGTFFANKIQEFLTEFNISSDNIQALGCHGQTMWHQPERESRYSVQLGNASLIANQVQIDVIADFRNADMAFGGQGAPLAPIFHDYLFRSDSQKRVILNIGGIANITCLTAGQDITGYDTGPGNILMDAWIETHRDLPYDKNGQWAKTGTIHNDLLHHLLDDDWLRKPPPKSTGREYFNMAWLKQKLQAFEIIKPEDVQATLVDFTAQSIADQVKIVAPEVLIVCGGGAQNTYLMERLQSLCSFCSVQSCQDYNVDPDALEASAFAWLAWRHCQRKTGNLPFVTGASQTAILGALYPHTRKE